MTDIIAFDYDGAAVRTITREGEPWFVLSDLCAILGLSNPTVVAQRIDEAALSQTEIRSGGQMRNVIIVNESGMYEVVIRSDKAEAVKFRRWLTGEVLPAIRKTGSYGAPALDLNALDPRTLALAILEESDRANAAEKQLAVVEAQVTVDAPKVAYVEQFVAQDDRVSLRALAGNLGIPETQLRTLLVVKNWIYCETEQRWSNTKGKLEIRNRYSAYSDKKPYFQNVLNHEAPRFKGGDVMHTLKITPAGAEAIARLVKKESAS